MTSTDIRAERRLGIGGSDVAAILCLSRRRGPLDIWRAKLGLDDPGAEKPCMRRGKFLEPALLDWYAAETGQNPERDVVLVDDWRRAQIDGRLTDRVVEGKTVSVHAWRSGEWGDPGTDQIPEDHLCQVQWQMDMAGVDLADVVVAVLPDDPDEVMGLSAAEVMEQCDQHVYQIHRRRPVCDVIRDRCAKFWTLNVLKAVPPDARDYAEAETMWWQARAGSEIRATPEIAQWVAALQVARNVAKAAREVEDRAKFRIAEFMQDHETLSGPNGSWLAWKNQKRAAYSVPASESKPMRFLRWWQKSPEFAAIAETQIDIPIPQIPQETP